jgi:hypothetical protein
MMAEREDIALLISGVVMTVLFGSLLLILAVSAASQPVWYALATTASCVLTPPLSWWIAGRMAGPFTPLSGSR